MPQQYVRLKWSVDTKKLDRRMSLLSLGFKNAGKLSIKEIGEMGKTQARRLAPKDSGRTFQGIILTGVNEESFTILAKNPTASDGHTRGNASREYFTRGKFNLVKWMHESPYAEKHIKTGEEDFMYRTADYIRQLAPNTIRAEFNKVIVKTR